MTTETQPARMGDDAIRAGWEATFSTNNPFCPIDLKSFTKAVRWYESARELSAHGGDGGGDRAALKHIATVLGPKVPKCCQGCRWEWQEALQTATAALATQQPASGEHGPIGDAELDAAREPNPLYAAHGGSGEVAPGILECSNCESIDDSARPGCPECMGIEDLCQRLAEHGAKSGRRAATKQYSDGVPTHTEMLMGQAIDAIRRLSDPAYAKVISSQDGLLGRSSTSPIRTRGPGDTGQSDPEFDFDEPTGHCESGDPNCGPVEHWDSEGVPLCQACWESCSPFNLPGPKGFDPTPPASASEAEVQAVAFAVMNPTGQIFDLSDRKEVAQRTADERNKKYPPKARLSQAVEVIPLFTRSPARVGGVTDWTEDARNWGNALNEASWKFTEVCPEKSALLFNHSKPALREAILTYASALVRQTSDQEKS